MKKLLIAGSMLMSSMAVNAAVVPVVASITEADLVATTTFGTTLGTHNPANIEFTATTDFTVTSLFKGTDPSSLVSANWTVFEDTNSDVGHANTGAQLASFSIGQGKTASFKLEAGKNYIFSYSATLPAGTTANVELSAVPVPAAALLFAPALLGFVGLRRKKTV